MSNRHSLARHGRIQDRVRDGTAPPAHSNSATITVLDDDDWTIKAERVEPGPNLVEYGSNTGTFRISRVDGNGDRNYAIEVDFLMSGRGGRKR